MDPDVTLILGLVIGGFAIPSVLSAMSDRRPLWASALTILLAFGLVLYAVMTKSGGYKMDQIPDVFFAVLGRYF